MTQLIECIPNFSEARRPEVIDQIVAAITSVEGARLLDRSWDFDHNRTVLTFAGPPEAVEEAAFRAIKTASELIDLNNHTGEHPRIGATDVVPFVPLSGASMDDCIAIAKRLGERVGNELGIPVYLYEAAATRPERANLENIRKGQYEGLKAEIESNAERTPDFGPAKLGSAGATVIGARNPLIAFNVYLTTDNVNIATKIAKVIRQSSGGLRHVKALGLLVDGRAQVSMNLTNFRETPIGRVVEAIRHLAERYGVGTHHCELIGLIPQDALVDAAVWHNATVDEFSPDQILESRLFQTNSSYPSDFRQVDSSSYSRDVIKLSMSTIDRKLRVFLCHASGDKAIVRELYQRFLAEGWIDPWLDEKKLLPGQDWDIEIEKAVEASNVVIVCLSRNSVSKDGYIQKELRFALNVALEKPVGSIFLVPVRFDDCFIPRSIRSIQYIDYFPWDRKDAAYHLIYESLNIAAQRYQVDPHKWKANQLIELKNVDQAVRKHNSSTFLEDVAAANATPGGGSTAAYAGALGAALVEMVSGLTIGKKKYAQVEAEMQVVRDQALVWRLELMGAADDDASAFEVLMSTFKLPKETEEQKKNRGIAIHNATLNAAHVPLHVAEDAVKVMELALKCAKDANVNAISDAMSGFAMARAALTAAGYNVRANLNSLDDKSAGKKMLKELAELETKAEKIETEIRQVMKTRGGI